MSREPYQPKFTTTTESSGLKRHIFDANELDDAAGIDVDFDALIAERNRLQEFAGKHKITQEIGSKLVDHYQELHGDDDWETRLDQDIQPYLDQVIQQIKAEHLLDTELEDLIDITALSDLRKYINTSQHITLGELPHGALAMAKGKKVTVTEKLLEQTTPLQSLFQMAQLGVPSGIYVPLHEEVHTLQPAPADPIANKMFLESVTAMVALAASMAVAIDHLNTILPAVLALATLRYRQLAKHHTRQRQEASLIRETQAHLADAQLWDASYVRTKPLVEIMQKDNPLYNQKSLTKEEVADRVIAAAQQINRLRAIGAPHNDVARLVGNARWDEKTHGYDTLDKAIVEVEQETQLTPEHMDGYVDAARLKQQIRILRIRGLAREAFEQFSGEVLTA